MAINNDKPSYDICRRLSDESQQGPCHGFIDQCDATLAEHSQNEQVFQLKTNDNEESNKLNYTGCKLYSKIWAKKGKAPAGYVEEVRVAKQKAVEEVAPKIIDSEETVCVEVQKVEGSEVVGEITTSKGEPSLPIIEAAITTNGYYFYPIIHTYDAESEQLKRLAGMAGKPSTNYARGGVNAIEMSDLVFYYGITDIDEAWNQFASLSSEDLKAKAEHMRCDDSQMKEKTFQLYWHELVSIVSDVGDTHGFKQYNRNLKQIRKNRIEHYDWLGRALNDAYREIMEKTFWSLEKKEKILEELDEILVERRNAGDSNFEALKKQGCCEVMVEFIPKDFFYAYMDADKVLGARHEPCHQAIKLMYTILSHRKEECLKSLEEKSFEIDHRLGSVIRECAIKVRTENINAILEFRKKHGLKMPRKS